MTNRCDEFLKLMTQIEHFARKSLRAQPSMHLSRLITRLQERRPSLASIPEMHDLVQLRNTLTHNGGCADPLVEIGDRALRLATEFRDAINPRTAIEVFGREVECVAGCETMGEVLRIVHERDYSQFPVLTDENLVGVVTEHSIARYIARQAAKGLDIINLCGVTVQQIVDHDQGRNHFCLALADEPVDVLVDRFQQVLTLEAVLITTSGDGNEPLLGIATTWDIAQIAPPYAR
jgi:predicted transcriptional regulator